MPVTVEGISRVVPVAHHLHTSVLLTFRNLHPGSHTSWFPEYQKKVAAQRWEMKEISFKSVPLVLFSLWR